MHLNFLMEFFHLSYMIQRTATFLWLVIPGIIPLYYGITEAGEIMFASEAKCLKEDCPFITTFPPGNYLKISSKNNLTREDVHILKRGEGQSTNVCFTKYYTPNYDNDNTVINDNDNHNLDVDELTTGLSERLTRSVQKRLMTDVPYAVLLSGGLDSSLVASIITECVKKKVKNSSFSIGLKGAPDLAVEKLQDFWEQFIMKSFSLYKKALTVSVI